MDGEGLLASGHALSRLHATSALDARQLLASCKWEALS